MVSVAAIKHHFFFAFSCSVFSLYYLNSTFSDGPVFPNNSLGNLIRFRCKRNRCTTQYTKRPKSKQNAQPQNQMFRIQWNSYGVFLLTSAQTICLVYGKQNSILHEIHQKKYIIFHSDIFFLYCIYV